MHTPPCTIHERDLSADSGSFRSRACLGLTVMATQMFESAFGEWRDRTQQGARSFTASIPLTIYITT